MKGIIYKYTFSDGKVYIGQTRRHPDVRKREHFSKIVGPANTGFWEAYNRLGEPEYEELYQVENEDEDDLVAELNCVETYFIRQYDADNPDYGYNKKSFGTVGTKAPRILDKKKDEYLENLLKERMKEYESAVNKIYHTKEPLTFDEKYVLKEKYRKDNMWQYVIDKYNFDNLADIDLDNPEEEFLLDEALEFVEFLIRDEAENEALAYVNNNRNELLNDELGENAIVQIDKDGNVVREYYSLNEVCEAFNIPRAANVWNVLKGKQKSAYGYYWKYKRDLKKEKNLV